MTIGKHYRYRKLEFWAERGLVNLIDERFPPTHNRSFVVITVREWLTRLKSLNGELYRWDKWPDERDKLHNFIDNGIACAREATKQGRPDDPAAVAALLKDRRKIIFVGNNQPVEIYTASASEAPEGKLLQGIVTGENSNKKLIVP